MSYLVLARKYRPRNFREMVGQPHVVTALGNALVQKRLHHAYLFTGTRGVGKTTVSRILAKSLNCVGHDGQGDITADPCGVCEVCLAIDAGNFVDYTELDAASNRGVDEVQHLLEQAVYKPVQGRFKVFMIDEVHMLTNTAFNAMLKTLEEPPEYLKFVLATTDPQKVPVTVLSRCLQFNLRPMAPETVRDHLHTVLQAESVVAEAGALTLLSRAARGSMRDALSLTDQAIAFGSGQVLEDTVRQMLGAVDRQQVLGLVAALAQGDGAQVVTLVDQARAAGLNAAGLLEDMAQVLQQMAVLQVVQQDVASDADVELQQVHALAAFMPRDETQLLYSLCIHGKAELGLAPDEYAGLTMVLLRLLAFKPAGTEKKTLDLAGSVGSAAQVPASAPAHALAAPTPPPAAFSVQQPESASVVTPEPRVAVAPQQGPEGVLPQAAQAQANAPLRPAAVQAAVIQPERTGGVVVASVAPAVSAHQEPAVPCVTALTPVVSMPEAKHAPAVAVEAAAPMTLVAGVMPQLAPDLPAPHGGAKVADVVSDEADWRATDEALDAADGWGEPVWDEWHGEPEGTAPSASPVVVPSQAVASEPPRFEAPFDPPCETAVRDIAVPAEQEGYAQPASATALRELVTTSLGDVWYDVVNQLMAGEYVTAFVRELALQSQLMAQEGATWRLHCESGLLGNPSNVERLKAGMAQLGQPVQLEVIQAATSDTPALRNQHAKAVRLQAAFQRLEQDPFVRALQRDFGATIIDQSVQPL